MTTSQGRRLATVALTAAATVALSAQPASADKVGTITPVFECTMQDATAGTYTAWYGYENTDSTAGLIKADTGQNRVLGSVDQPQPETFEPGSHPHAFSVVTTTPYSGWVLDGDTVYADYSAAGACPEATLPVTTGHGVPLLLVGFGLVLPASALALSRERRRVYPSLSRSAGGDFERYGTTEKVRP